MMKMFLIILIPNLLVRFTSKKFVIAALLSIFSYLYEHDTINKTLYGPVCQM